MTYTASSSFLVSLEIPSFRYEEDIFNSFLPLTDEYGRTYTGMIALVMRLSGGRIRDAKTASYALAIAAGTILVISLFLFFRASGPSLPPASEVLRNTPTSGLRPGAALPQ